MQDATRDHLAQHNMLASDGRINWSALVGATKDLLLDGRIVAAENEIPEKAMSINEIREVVLGQTNDDEINAQLNQLITNVVGIGTKGRLQLALENGYVLCTTRVHKVLIEGEAPTSVPVRFVSGDDQVVDQFNTQLVLNRAYSAAKAGYATVEQNTKRVALLAPKKRLLLEKAQEQLALAMPLNES